jgi:uncharacterized protein
MEVRLDRVAEERFEWSESLSIPISELTETDLVDLGEVNCRGRIERTSHTSFLLTATLEYKQTLACVRCLREIVEDVSTELQLLITVGKSPARAAGQAAERAKAPAGEKAGGRTKEGHRGNAEADGEEHELVEEDLGVLILSEPVLDTRPIVVEQLHLGIPMKPLCREDCQGLCGQCGADLNEGNCSCSPAGDSRLAKLAALRDKLGEQN